MAKKASAKHRPKSSPPQGRGATQRCTIYIYIFIQDTIYQLQFNYINSNQLLSERNSETSSGKTSSQSKVTLSWPSILGVLQNYGRLVAATGQKSIWSSLRGTEGYRSSLRDAGKTCVAIEGDIWWSIELWNTSRMTQFVSYSKCVLLAWECIPPSGKVWVRSMR